MKLCFLIGMKILEKFEIVRNNVFKWTNCKFNKKWNVSALHIISGDRKTPMIGIKNVRNKFMVAFHLSPSVTLLYKKQIEIKL